MNSVGKVFTGHWIYGTLIAFAGVAVSRLLAPEFAGRVHAMVALAGQFVALGGLMVILRGIRRRLGRAATGDARSAS
jgi:Na+-transporting NADH:ubiquinone oxidoreductase subunit NqrB